MKRFIFLLILCIPLVFAQPVFVDVDLISPSNGTFSTRNPFFLNASITPVINKLYDDFEAANVNWTRWSNSTTPGPTITQSGGQMIIATGTGGNEIVQVSSLLLPSLPQIHFLEFNVSWSSSGADAFRGMYFGEQTIKTQGSTGDQALNYKVSRLNHTTFSVLENDAFVRYISPTSNTFKVNVSVVGTDNTVLRLAYVNYTTNLSNFNTTNATLNLWVLNGSTYSLVSSNITFMNQSGTTNVSYGFSNLATGIYRWNVLGCARNTTLSTCSFAPQNFSFSYGFTVDSNIYNATTFEASLEAFITNITTPGVDSPSSVFLNWDNVRYAGTISAFNSTTFTLTRNLVIPSGTGTKNWFWEINFANGAQINTSILTQTVSAISVDNCTTFTNNLFNISLYDEDTRTYNNGTIEVLLTFFNSDKSRMAGQFNRSYTVTEIVKSARICMDTLNSTYLLDYEFKYYGNSSYVVEYKFAQDIRIENTTTVQNVDLYDLLDARSTPFTITLTSVDLDVIHGAVVDVQRQYIPQGEFRSVEGPITDRAGSTVGHLVSREVYYNFVVSKNGTLLGTFNNYNVQCQNEVTGDCRISLNLAQATGNIEDFENYGNVSLNFLWNRDTRTLILDFFSTNGQSQLVAWNVTQADNYGNNTICVNSLSATVGEFTCVIPTSYGNSSIYADVYSNNVYLGRKWFKIDPNPESIFGGTRVVLGLLMYSTLTFLLFGHPAMMIIGSMLGIAFSAAFSFIDGGTFFGNTAVIIWYIMAGFILINYMRNKI